VTLPLALIMEVGYIVSICLPNGNFMQIFHEKAPGKKTEVLISQPKKHHHKTILLFYPYTNWNQKWSSIHREGLAKIWLQEAKYYESKFFLKKLLKIK